MNANLLTDVVFDSEDSWGSFQLIHGMTHQNVYDTMLRQSLVPYFVPLYDFPREAYGEYLLSHYQAHLSNARLLVLPGIPDLSSVDLNDEGQFRDWLGLHAVVHLNENAALGL